MNFDSDCQNTFPINKLVARSAENENLVFETITI
jgi:hypothetical protein